MCDAYWTVHTGSQKDAENLVDTTVQVNGRYVSLGGLQVRLTTALSAVFVDSGGESVFRLCPGVA